MISAAATWKWDFFIAHAGADKAMAERLYDLMVSGARVFLDSRCLELGDDWDAALTAAQRTSRVTVVLVSSNTEKAYYEREEVAAALALARDEGEAHRVVPVYVDSDASSLTAVPYGLRLKHGLHLSGRLTLSDAAGELLSLLHRLPAAAGSTAGNLSPARISQRPGILHEPPETWPSPVRRNRWRYKVVAFDLDGTLLRGVDFEFSWEAVWRELAFGRAIQGKLKREYRQRSEADPSRPSRIRAYEDWCEKACAQFKSRGLTRRQLKDLASKLSLTQHCRKALTGLKAEGVVTAIISGGINTFLEDAFTDYRTYIDFVFINELLFAPNGALEGVRATPFDFQGKAEALEMVCERVGCTPSEVVFVGDHFNDEAIMLKVDRAIAFPPMDAVVKGVAHASIIENDLMAILPHVLVE